VPQNTIDVGSNPTHCTNLTENEMKYHIDKTGRKILIKDLETSHLENIIKFIEQKAKNGLVIQHGGGTTAEDMWYDEDHLFGEEVLEHMNYYDYKNELNSRINKGATMPEPTILVNQKITEVTFRKDGVSPKGNTPYKLYTVNLQGRSEDFSYFQDSDKPYLTAGMNVIVFKFTTSIKGKYTNHTINEIEIDPTSQSSQQRISEPTYHPVNEKHIDLKDPCVFTSYAMEIAKTLLPYSGTLQKLSIGEISLQCVTSGLAMYRKAMNFVQKPTTAAKPATTTQPKPPAQSAPKPEPVDVPNVPFDDVVPPPEDESDLPF